MHPIRIKAHYSQNEFSLISFNYLITVSSIVFTLDRVIILRLYERFYQPVKIGRKSLIANQYSLISDGSNQMQILNMKIVLITHSFDIQSIILNFIENYQIKKICSEILYNIAKIIK